MRKTIFAALIAATLLGTTVAYAQDNNQKSDKKERKAIKKIDKGKEHKALKKAVKSEKKEEVGH